MWYSRDASTEQGVYVSHMSQIHVTRDFIKATPTHAAFNPRIPNTEDIIGLSA
jgi:hypothetical protein